MKKNLFLLCILTFLTFSSLFAQPASNAKYNYAEVTIHLGGFNKFKSTALSFGVDYPVQIEKKEEMTTKVMSFTNAIDIKNYMADLGWEYVDVQNMLFSDMVVIYTFRKTK